MALKFLNDGYFAGKVGIGTESPQTGVKLDVRGNVRIGDGSSAEQDIHFNNSTTEWQVGTNNAGNGTDNNQFYFYEGGNYRLTVQKGGNVGIGTTSPGVKLDVNGDSVRVINANPKYYLNNSVVQWYTTIATNDYRIHDGIDDRLTIKRSSGNVGVGTTNPAQKFVVANATNGQGIEIVPGTTGTIQAYNRGTSVYVPLNIDTLEARVRSIGATVFNNGSGFSESMRITSTGSVGIGNTAPIFYSGYSSITLGGTSGTTNGLIKFGTGTSNDGPEIFTNTSKDLTFNKAGSGTNMVLYGTGTVRFNNYNSANQTGTPTYLLGTDASGNIVKTNTIPGSDPGPYLPLAGGTMTGNTVHNDNVKSIYGTASDGLEIYHDGTDSIIADTGTGNLYIRGAASMRLQGINQSNFLIASQGGNVNLYYNNANKFDTTNTGVNVTGEIQLNTKALLSNQENTDVDTGTETVANVAIATYTAAFFDFVIKKTTNVRSGTVYACHDGTNVEFTETSTQDLGDTSDVTLSVDISGGNMRLLATVTSDDWSVKSLIRAI